MAERGGPRVVKQRRLEAPPSTELPEAPPVAPPPSSPPPPITTRPADEPVPPSNRSLLERQLRWHRERSKFESKSETGESPR